MLYVYTGHIYGTHDLQKASSNEKDLTSRYQSRLYVCVYLYVVSVEYGKTGFAYLKVSNTHVEWYSRSSERDLRLETNSSMYVCVCLHLLAFVREIYEMLNFLKLCVTSLRMSCSCIVSAM